MASVNMLKYANMHVDLFLCESKGTKTISNEKIGSVVIPMDYELPDSCIWIMDWIDQASDFVQSWVSNERPELGNIYESYYNNGSIVLELSEIRQFHSLYIAGHVTGISDRVFIGDRQKALVI